MKNFTKLIIILIASVAILSCQNTKEKKQTVKQNIKTITEKEVKFVKTISYAVVWDWSQNNTVDKILPVIQKQVPVIIDLWKKGTIENVYMDTESKLNDTETFSKVFFIIKGKNIKQVKAILDDTPLAKAGIANYKLYPLGVKWLKRNNKAVELVQKTKNTFAVVWNPIEYNTKYKALLGEQNIKLLKLWNEGVIENAYLDTESIGKKDIQETALVYFINASTKKDASEILNEFPFVKESVGTYTLHKVGRFWMSTPDKY